MEDDTLRARIENNLGSAYLACGEIGSASKHYIVALQLYESLGIRTEAARARWSIGAVALAAGNATEAIRRLAAAKLECENLGMLGDAALVALDLCEACVLAGEHVEVRWLASEALERAKEAGIVPAALTALSYLREAAAARMLTPQEVQYVKRFVRRLEAEPTLAFMAPQSVRRG